MGIQKNGLMERVLQILKLIDKKIFYNFMLKYFIFPIWTYGKEFIIQIMLPYENTFDVDLNKSKPLKTNFKSLLC